jgi:hypothetical protein
MKKIKIKTIDSITTLINMEACREILITFGWPTNLLHNNLLLLLFNLENYEVICPFFLKLQKLQLTIIMHNNTRSCVGLRNCMNIIEIKYSI